jgi:hypothetical protein
MLVENVHDEVEPLLDTILDTSLASRVIFLDEKEVGYRLHPFRNSAFYPEQLKYVPVYRSRSVKGSS